MNVQTISINGDEAIEKLRAIQRLRADRRVREDDAFKHLYAAVEKGARIVNIVQAFKQTGLSDRGHPRLAIARADFKEVHCHLNPYMNHEGYRYGSAVFSPRRIWNESATKQNIILPAGIYEREKIADGVALKSPVPYIPPDIRRKCSAALQNYHVLFEVQKWDEYPVDPFLLRRAMGALFVVVGEWELTPLEASLLDGMMRGM
jgi:hypothetical protein